MEIRKLNTLRGVAALIVVVSHYSNTTNLFEGYLGHGAGQFGVMIFFMLSGFLMSYLYLSKPFSGNAVGRYLIARLARIMPLFFAVVGVSFGLQQLGIKGVFFEITDWQQVLQHVLFVSGVNVLWTIPPEVQFYGVFVFLWWLASKSLLGLWVFLIACFGAIYVAGFPLLILPWFDSIVGLQLIQSLPYFFVGVLFGKLYGVWTPPKRLMNHGFILAFLLVPLLYPKIYTLMWPEGHGLWKDVDVLMVISAVFFMLVFLVPAGNRLLSNVLGDFLGKVSFSLYLLHLPVLHFFETFAKSAPLAYFPLFLLSALLVAYLSYVLLECPSRGLVRRLPAKVSRYFQGADYPEAMVSMEAQSEPSVENDSSRAKPFQN